MIRLLTALLMVMIVFSLVIGTMFYYETQKSFKQEQVINKLSSDLKTFTDKDLAIKNMEETLRIAYDFLSTYEAHYYSVIIHDFAKKYDMPWEIFAALIRIESNFDPTVKSEKDAKGLIQVMEATGKAVAEKIGIRFKENKTLWNDILNACIGFSYFGEGYEEKVSEGKEVALIHAVKRYLGGSNYSKKSDHKVYIQEYKLTIWQEYRRLIYIYKGVCSDKGNS